MATSFQHQPFGGGPPKPPQDMLDYLLAPASGWGYKRQGDWANVMIDPLEQIQRGSKNYGIKAWDDLFDESGRITDPFGLLKSLNLGSVVAQKPTSMKELFWNQGEEGRDWWRRITGNGQLSPLENWLRNISDVGQAQKGSWTMYDPSSLRFTMDDLQNLGTLDDLNAWAQKNYGVDAQTLAASSPKLLETRQAWANDPSLWWDAAFPNEAAVTAVPGMPQIDVAGRLAGWQDMQARLQAEAGLRAQEGSLMAQNQALAQNPYLARTSLGRYLGVQGPNTMNIGSVLGRTQLPQTGYDFLLQSSLIPEQLRQQLAQMSLQI